jgi:hypothetical protein
MHYRGKWAGEVEAKAYTMLNAPTLPRSIGAYVG